MDSELNNFILCSSCTVIPEQLLLREPKSSLFYLELINASFLSDLTASLPQEILLYRGLISLFSSPSLNPSPTPFSPAKPHTPAGAQVKGEPAHTGLQSH